jgi:hypothetical protein
MVHSCLARLSVCVSHRGEELIWIVKLDLLDTVSRPRSQIHMIDVARGVDRKVGSDAGRLRLDRHMRNRVPGIAGSGRCGLPAFGIAHHDVGDRFSGLKLNVRRSERLTIDGRVRAFAVRVKVSLTAPEDLP